ncbi:unnamed protein product [Brassicogethes aeneus]|uniref:DUF4795 domain-containing protein n=1 Tax=Brassicogethes aeneus TaxID=1431903 RepID=A0A9P0FPK1_BRAAE|nr:unnamed protein product [Brassicogethes aeneus]
MSKSTIITLPQMVDLALNAPEIGIVNFSVLHSVLHVLVQQMNLTDCNVEFRGSDSERLQNYIASAKPGPIIALTEYTVGPTGEEVLKSKEEEKGKADESQTEKTEEAKSIVVIEQKSQTRTDTKSQFTMAITQDRYENLVGDIKDLQEKVQELAELPGNLGLVNTIRSEKPSPVLDMFHIMKISKRVDALDAGMKKISSLVEDLALEKKGEGPLMDEKDTLIRKEDIMELEARLVKLEEGGLVSASPANLERRVFISPSSNKIRSSTSKNQTPRSSTDGANIDQEHEDDATTRAETVIDFGVEDLSTLPINEAIYLIQKDLELFHHHVDNLFGKMSKDIKNLKNMDLEEQLKKKEEEGDDLAEIKPLAGSHAPQVDENLDKRLRPLEEQLANLKNISDTLWSERSNISNMIDAIKNNIMTMVTNLKADKDEMDDALLEKADLCLLDEKVSKNQLDEVIDELMNNIMDNGGQLSKKLDELAIQTAEVTEEVKTKMGIQDLDGFKDLTNAKFALLSEKIKALSNLKDDVEAAGAKTKFLKNVTCISCDQEVKMRREIDSTAFPKAPALQTTGKSMGAYLSYELDHLRRMQKCTNKNKSLNVLEQALKFGKLDRPETDHICNRYCGGSHTNTTFEQRVSRVGHFLNQWVPESTTLKDGGIRGTDGKMYKGRECDEKKEVIKQNQETEMEIAEVLEDLEAYDAQSKEDLSTNIIKKPIISEPIKSRMSISSRLSMSRPSMSRPSMSRPSMSRPSISSKYYKVLMLMMIGGRSRFVTPEEGTK